MRTTLYLIRHAATEANLVHPPRLQGRQHNPPLAPLGVHQAAATRDFLAIRPIDVCYCSPLVRALQTATIISGPHGLMPIIDDRLIEADIGKWEGMDWQQIRYLDAANYREFMANPAEVSYPDGENFTQVALRATFAINEIIERHIGQTILIVSHHIVNRTYLASLMGIGVANARTVELDNCGISVVARVEDTMHVNTLNAAFHLQSLAA
jgi:broad specificity phosphatase PhoE